jgi:TRAP-type C4-dicarboxylate transport system substrate-binding protein
VFDNHYQVAKHFTLTEHLIVPEILVFSRKTWAAMSAADQALLMKVAAEAQQDARVLWNAKEKEAFDKIKEAKIEVIQIPDKTPFQNAVKPVWDKYGAQYADMVTRIQAVK